MRDDIDLYLIRHAQSEANVDQSINRHKADHAIELTDLGREQARSSGQALASILAKKHLPENHVLGDKINRLSAKMVQLWVSPYSRTRETAKIIGEELTNLGFKTHFVEEPVLIEQQYGIFDGYPDDALPDVFPNEWREYDKWCKQQGKFYARMPNGESKFDVYMRIYQFLDAFYRNNDEIQRGGVKINVVVSHGVTLRMLKARLLRMSVEDADKLRNPWNCSIESIEPESYSGLIPSKNYKSKTVFEGFKAEHVAEPNPSTPRIGP